MVEDLIAGAGAGASKTMRLEQSLMKPILVWKGEELMSSTKLTKMMEMTWLLEQLPGSYILRLMQSVSTEWWKGETMNMLMREMDL